MPVFAGSSTLSGTTANVVSNFSTTSPASFFFYFLPSFVSLGPDFFFF